MLNKKIASNTLDLQAISLRHMLLPTYDLSDIDLSFADMHGISLSEGSLSRTTLVDADLSTSDLRNVDLSQANMANVDLHNAMLRCTILHGANLSGVDMSLTTLSGANFSRTHLAGATLPPGIDLKDLAPARLVILPSHQTSDDAIRLSTPDGWNPATLDRYLNHINNPDSGSLLTSIDSISSQYGADKIRLAKQLIDSLQNIDVSSVVEPLLDIWSKAPYCTIPEITLWLDNLCGPYLEKFNFAPLPTQNVSLLDACSRFFKRHPDRMLSCNGAFIQVVAWGITFAEGSLERKTVIELYDNYLALKRVRPYTQIAGFGGYGTHRPDWQDPHAANIIVVSPLDQNRIMMISPQGLAMLLGQSPGEHGQGWTHFYLYEGVENLGTEHYGQRLLERYFPLFLPAYLAQRRPSRFDLLLKTLKLGDSLYALFDNATRAATCEIKLHRITQQLALQKIFESKLNNKVIPGRYVLTDEHYLEIVHAYGLEHADDTTKGRLLFCLAGVFTKYSSSAIFGTEGESPIILRSYAYSLLHQANALSPELLEPAIFSDWEGRLVGENGAFTCTAVLSNIMIEYAKAHFPATFAGVMPLSWY